MIERRRFVKKWKAAKGTVALLFFTLTVPGEAYAYLDPGTGSFMLQIILGTVFAALFTIKMYWQKLKNFYRKLRGKDPVHVEGEDKP